MMIQFQIVNIFNGSDTKILFILYAFWNNNFIFTKIFLFYVVNVNYIVKKLLIFFWVLEFFNLQTLKHVL